jgi:hypothetical protein
LKGKLYFFFDFSQKKINGTTTNTNIENKLNSSKFGNPIGHNNQQHSDLMNEFKKAHKRMFKKSVVETEGDMVSNRIYSF